jgi:hypothetical protein
VSIITSLLILSCLLFHIKENMWLFILLIIFCGGVGSTDDKYSNLLTPKVFIIVTLLNKGVLDVIRNKCCLYTMQPLLLSIHQNFVQSDTFVSNHTLGVLLRRCQCNE